MTEENLKKISEIQSEIVDKKRKIRTIDLLLSGSEFNCKITGTPKGWSIKTDYCIECKEELIKLLQLDKNKLIAELLELEKEFTEM